MNRYVTFGEVMLRLAPPEHELLLQNNLLEATFGGAEANVAVSLANYGCNVSFVTAAPVNPIGDAMVRELRGFGVDTQFIRRAGERLGIYYAEGGACMRPSKVVYDRAHSSICEAKPGDFDWDKIFEGATWFHTTGITPAVSSGAADLVLEAMKAAHAKGITVSCDLNYRKKLWKWGKKPVEFMPRLMDYIDVVIANEEDCQKCLGIAADADVTSGQLNVDVYRDLSKKILSRWLNVRCLAVSLRESISADWNNWSAILATRDGFYQSKKYEIRDIVDRVGGGDAFGSGLIFGLNEYKEPQPALEFAVAASALKHTIRGDYNRVSVSDVLTLSGGDASGRVQR